jgi:hypothetical protein
MAFSKLIAVFIVVVLVKLQYSKTIGCRMMAELTDNLGGQLWQI